MELMEGYKKTELGVIPTDWNVKSIDSITTISIGGDLKILHFSARQNEKCIYPVYSNTVSNRGLYGYYDFVEYSGDSITVIGRGVGIGKAFSRNGSYGAIGRLIVLFPKEEIDVIFLTEYINNRIEIFFESGGIPQLTGIAIGRYHIPIPPTITEQTAIATALSDTDALIRSLEKLIAKKEYIKQGVMQELLKPKDGWEIKRLGEIATIITGSTPPTNDLANYGNEFLFVSPIDLGKGKHIIDSEKKLSLKGFSISRKLPKNSILFTCIGSIGKVGISSVELASNQQINAILPNEFYSTDYLYYQLLLLVPQIRASASEQVLPLINKTDFEKMEIWIPSLDDQIYIANILSDMDLDISALQSKLQKYRLIKSGMMQTLLTGKIRLI